jgi:hypothetical protein
MELNKKNIQLFGSIALLGALGGVLADLFSAWSNTPNSMATAISIDAQTIKGLFLDKPRWSFILGNYLGVFFIPLHMFGFYLIHIALKPAGKFKAYIFLVLSIYIVAIGAGFHGTLAFIGDTIQSGDNELLNNMLTYWQNWGAVMIIGYLGISIFLLALIVSGKTLYSRKSAFLSPLALMVASTILITILPVEFYGTKKFFAVTGLNFPLLIFYIVTLTTLLKKIGITSQPSPTPQSGATGF